MAKRDTDTDKEVGRVPLFAAMSDEEFLAHARDLINRRCNPGIEGVLEVREAQVLLNSAIRAILAERQTALGTRSTVEPDEPGTSVQSSSVLGPGPVVEPDRDDAAEAA